MTNINKIRGMATEEIAEKAERTLLCPPGKCVRSCKKKCGCKECWIEWLNADEDE